MIARRPPPPVLAPALAAALAALAGCAGPAPDGAPASPEFDREASWLAPADARDAGAPVALDGVDEPAPPADPPRFLDDPTGALAPFYAGLAALERGDDVRLRILQFGDSHTAGDKLTGHVRHVLQARHGDAGRGFVLPGRPAIRHYYLGDVRYGTDGAWQAHQGSRRDTEEPYGIAGVRCFADDPKALAWIETCDDCAAGTAVETFEIFFLRRPGGGDLEARVDDGPWTRISTALAPDAGDAPVPDTHVIEVADGPHRLSLRPRKKKQSVHVFGVALERRRPGVVVDALGVVGLRMSHLWSWDWTVIGAQLAHRDPTLVILQYGTNEAYDPDLDLVGFEERYVELIGRVRAAVPGAAVLVLGPPDHATRELGRECAKLDKQRERAAARARKRGVEPPPDEPVPGCEWRTPAILHDIVAAERRAARRAGVAFFDSLAALGGPDQIDGMVTADPPLAYPDHVHYTTAGYAAWADLLLEDLNRGRASWEKQVASAP